MPARAWRSPAAARSPKSLAARGGLVRTFGGLATFLVLTFLCAGIYLLEDAVANPLAAQAAALIFAAFIIALAAILLFYLSGRRMARQHPGRNSRGTASCCRTRICSGKL
jgi:hypothetical protein